MRGYSRIRHLQLESEPSSRQLESDLRSLAERALLPPPPPPPSHQRENDDDEKGRWEQEELDGFDLLFVVQGVRFRGHRVRKIKRGGGSGWLIDFTICNFFPLFATQVVFSKRSDYFQALLADHFRETETTGFGGNGGSANSTTTTTTVALRGVRPEVFAEVVRHVYSNTQEVKKKNEVNEKEKIHGSTKFFFSSKR